MPVKYVLIYSFAADYFNQYQGGGTLSHTDSATYNFAKATDVTQCSWSMTAYANTDTYSSAPACSASVSVELYYAGAWHTIAAASQSGSTTASASIGATDYTIYKDVTAARYSNGASAQSDHDERVTLTTSSLVLYTTPPITGHAGVV